jgi:hypothetical protein
MQRPLEGIKRIVGAAPGPEMIQLHEVDPLVAPQERLELAGSAIWRKRVHPNLHQGNLAQETNAVGGLDGSNLLRGDPGVEADEQSRRIMTLRETGPRPTQ